MPLQWNIRRARPLVASAILVAVSIAPGLSAQSTDSLLALTNATVIDGTGRTRQPQMTVVVRNQRIAAIFPAGSQSNPPGARIIDLQGQFLIPGLIDAHVHLGTQARPPGTMQQILSTVFLSGVTAARDMGGSLRIVRPLAEHSRIDSVPSPRIFYAAILAGPGRWFTGPFGDNAADGMPIGTSPAVRRVDSSSDVPHVIADAKATGATGIKIYNAVSSDLVRRFVAEAHRQHMKAWSHLDVDPARPTDLVLAGVDVVSHGDQFRGDLALPLPPNLSDSARRAQRQREYATMSPDDPRITQLLTRMKAAGTILDPTLFIMLPQHAAANAPSPDAARLLSAFHFASAMTRRASRAGIPIVAGTDAIGGSAANLHAELQLLVDSAGLTPIEALQAAGINAARAIGVENSLGTIERGKLADLVVLRADPSQDIRNTQTVSMVIKAGRVFRRSTPMRIGPQAKPPG